MIDVEHPDIVSARLRGYPRGLEEPPLVRCYAIDNEVFLAQLNESEAE